MHLFIYLISKKILQCVVESERISDNKQLKQLLRSYHLIRVDIIFGDGGYDTCECFGKQWSIVQFWGLLSGRMSQRNLGSKKRRFGEYFFQSLGTIPASGNMDMKYSLKCSVLPEARIITQSIHLNKIFKKTNLYKFTDYAETFFQAIN